MSRRPTRYASAALVVASVMVAATACSESADTTSASSPSAEGAPIPSVGVTTAPLATTSTMVSGTTFSDFRSSRTGRDEQGSSELRTSGWDEYPYVRHRLTFPPGTPSAAVTWTGTSINLDDLALHVWDRDAQRWGDATDVAAPTVPGGPITLAADVAVPPSGEVEVMVIDSPRAAPTFVDHDASFADPSTYDFALQHISDTQYVSRENPEVYVEQTRWTADNAAARKIAYSLHTGDLIQSWIRPGGSDTQARKEFEVADRAQRIVEDAGVPTGVLPGNHDNLWNVAGRLVPGEHEKNHALYNEYFGPDRYSARPYWGGSFTDTDNSAHYDLVEMAGAKFLVLAIGYNPPEKVMQWAERVLADHPDRNVVIGAHYYLDEAGEKKPSGFGDIGASSGEQIWNRLVVPFESVFLVLSGHVDGQVTTVDRAVGTTDRTVVQMLADYQYFEVEGRRATGFQRLLQFDLDGGSVTVTTHSPTLNRFDVEAYDPKQRYDAQDGAFVTDIVLRADVPRRVAAG